MERDLTVASLCKRIAHSESKINKVRQFIGQQRSFDPPLDFAIGSQWLYETNERFCWFDREPSINREHGRGRKVIAKVKAPGGYGG
jgi:hypothetical protein